MTQRVEDDPANDGSRPRGVRLLRDVSFGNLMQMVPLLGLLGTAIATFFLCVSAVQRIEDGIAHEQATREVEIRSLQSKIEDLARQEARDVSDIKLSITGVRDDLRVLVNPGRR